MIPFHTGAGDSSVNLFFRQEPMQHEVLDDLLQPIRQLFDDVKRKATMRLEYEGLNKAEALEKLGSAKQESPANFAMERYAYYVCFKCSSSSHKCVLS